MSGSRAIYRYFYRQFGAGGLKGSDTILGRLLARTRKARSRRTSCSTSRMLLLLAGNETTTNLLGGMFDTLARDPESYNRIRADHSLIPMAIEEQLRYSSPVQNLYRTAGPTTLSATSRFRPARACCCLSAPPTATHGVRQLRTCTEWTEIPASTSHSVRRAPVPRCAADPDRGAGRVARARDTSERDRVVG